MFKLFLAFLAFFAVNTNGFQTADDFNNMHAEYQNYLVKYGKFDVLANPLEYMQRFQAFTTTNDKVEEHNSNPSRTWDMGHNKFSDRFPFELGHLRGYRPNPDVRRNHTVLYEYDPTDELPVAVDWRANGWVTNVKDEGECGSCWTFSATGTMEGQHANVSKNLVSLSEQELVDCVTNCYGCDGGEMNLAMEYVVANGGDDTESSYPYTATDGTCNFNKSNVGATFSKVVNLEKGDCQGLLHAVATVGPVSIAVNADAMMNYQTGIMNVTNDECDPNSLDHGVLVVGYGQTTAGNKFWIVKNSWGTEWGQDGYVYWDRDTDDMCGICQQAAFPVA